eukprot:10075052-Heterocapsa_arctica.AAC.1
MGYPKIEAGCWRIIAEAYISDEQHHEALQSQEQALELAREVEDGQQITFLLEMGMAIYYAYDEAEKAMDLVLEEVLLAQEACDLRREGNALRLIARAHI